MLRWILFFLMIAIGVAAGLGYGWMISPVEYVDSSIDALKADYRTDFVLMTAEAYAAEGDLATAVQRLALLGTVDPVVTVNEAVRFAERVGYADYDLALMRSLAAALAVSFPGEGAP